jgi:hypothetical protein
MIPPLKTLTIWLFGIGCMVLMTTISSNRTLLALTCTTETVVNYTKTKETTRAELFTDATAQALSNTTTINFRLQPEMFVEELTRCFNDKDCRIYYYHFGKSGGTGVLERMEHLYPPRLDSCCNGPMMDRFRKDPKLYCSLKFSSYEITSSDFLGRVMPTCYNITNQSRSIVLVTFREPLQRTLSYIHQMCNKNFGKRPKRLQEVCQRCSYAKDKDYWTEFLDGANDQYQQLYKVASATTSSLPDSTVLAVDLIDLSELYRDLYSATNHKAFSMRTSANPESTSRCNFGFTSEMFRGLRLANDVYRNLTLGIYQHNDEQFTVNKPK